MFYLKSISFLLIIVSTFLIFPSKIPSKKVKIERQSKYSLPKNTPRQSITFIMGTDEKVKNQYYTEAKNFYQYNEQEKTDAVIDTCRSLWSIQHYLEQNKPVNGLPWGKINVVVHSNEWTGISMPVFPNGERITTDLLDQINVEGEFPAFSTEVADEETIIQFQSCGLGRNELLVNVLQNLFRSEDCAGVRPHVTASPYFVFYQSEKYKGIPIQTDKYKAEVWYAFYKTGYREGDIKLSRQLSKRYPEASVNWRKALKYKKPENSHLFHYKFTIPIEWIVTYESVADRPNLTTKKAQQEWLGNEIALVDAVKDYNIPMDKFRWTFEETAYTFEDGITEPAILAKGLCTVVCILKKVE